jgi:hypothetical protein
LSIVRHIVKEAAINRRAFGSWTRRSLGQLGGRRDRNAAMARDPIKGLNSAIP